MPQLTCYEDDTLGIFNCQQIVMDGSFDKDSLRFELVLKGGFTQQGYWEKLRERDPERYKELLSRKQGLDADHPDDLVVEIGKCSPF